MPRSLLLATTVLAALTALGLLAAFVAVRPPVPVVVDGAAASANRAAVQRFYDAVNAGIAGGDPAPLGAILAPGFVEFGASGLDLSGRDGLERYVRALHEMVPGARLVPETVVAEEDRVLALVRVEGADRGDALGLALAEPTIWPPVDAFRLADGRIVERDAVGERRVLVERQARVSLDLPDLSEQIVTAVRISLPPRASRSVPGVDGVRLLYVGAGAPAFHGAPASAWEPAIDPASARLLAAGQRWVLADGDGYTVRNPGPEPAVLLEVLVTASASLTDADEALLPIASAVGGSVLTLAGGKPVTVPTGASNLAIGQARLAPGGVLTWDASPGPTLLIVEAGALDFQTLGGAARNAALVQRGAADRAVLTESAALAAGDGVLIDAATAVEVSNAGDEPLVVRLVTITPAEWGAVSVDGPPAIRRVPGRELEPD